MAKRMSDDSVVNVAVVTGALGGIGVATCDLLALKGYQVIGVDRHDGSLASMSPSHLLWSWVPKFASTQCAPDGSRPLSLRMV